MCFGYFCFIFFTICCFWFKELVRTKYDDIVGESLNTVIVRNENNLIIYKLGESEKINTNLQLNMALATATQSFSYNAAIMNEYQNLLNLTMNENIKEWDSQITKFLNTTINEKKEYKSKKYINCKLIRETRNYYLIEYDKKILLKG